MNIFNKQVAAGAVVALALVPLMASAQTTDVQSQIQALLSQIKALQEQLKTLVASSAGIGFTMMGSTTPMMPPGQMGKAACIALNRNLGLGSRGEDVKGLQEVLGEDPENEFHGSATGFFGPLTAQAVMKFQMRMGIASSTDGRVGPMTRGFFERRCGKGLDGDHGKQDGMMDAGHIAGSIAAVSSSSITVTPQGGQARTVNVTTSTTIDVFATATSTPASGTLANLTVGAMVTVEGRPQQDGSLTATRIKVGMLPPPMMDGRGGHGRGHGESGSDDR